MEFHADSKILKHLTPMIHLAGKMLNMTGHEYDQIKWYNSVRVLL